MDVRITLNVLLLSVLIMTTACQKKNENDVFANDANSQGGGGSSECPTQELIKSEFMVTYEDGRFEKVKAENREVFVKNFSSAKQIEFTLEGANGLYFAEIISGNNKSYAKVIKE